MSCTRTTCLPRMKWGSDPEARSPGTAILSESVMHRYSSLRRLFLKCKSLVFSQQVTVSV